MLNLSKLSMDLMLVEEDPLIPGSCDLQCGPWGMGMNRTEAELLDLINEVRIKDQR